MEVPMHMWGGRCMENLCAFLCFAMYDILKAHIPLWVRALSPFHYPLPLTGACLHMARFMTTP